MLEIYHTTPGQVTLIPKRIHAANDFNSYNKESVLKKIPQFSSGGSTSCCARPFFEDSGFRQFFPLYINTSRPLLFTDFLFWQPLVGVTEEAAPHLLLTLDRGIPSRASIEELLRA